MSSGVAGHQSWSRADLLRATALRRPFQKPSPERPHDGTPVATVLLSEVFVKATVTVTEPPALFPQISLRKGSSMQPQKPVSALSVVMLGK